MMPVLRIYLLKGDDQCRFHEGEPYLEVKYPLRAATELPTYEQDNVKRVVLAQEVLGASPAYGEYEHDGVCVTIEALAPLTPVTEPLLFELMDRHHDQPRCYVSAVGQDPVKVVQVAKQALYSEINPCRKLAKHTPAMNEGSGMLVVAPADIVFSDYAGISTNCDCYCPPGHVVIAIVFYRCYHPDGRCFLKREVVIGKPKGE